MSDDMEGACPVCKCTSTVIPTVNAFQCRMFSKVFCWLTLFLYSNQMELLAIITGAMLAVLVIYQFQSEWLMKWLVTIQTAQRALDKSNH